MPFSSRSTLALSWCVLLAGLVAVLGGCADEGSSSGALYDTDTDVDADSACSPGANAAVNANGGCYCPEGYERCGSTADNAWQCCELEVEIECAVMGERRTCLCPVQGVGTQVCTAERTWGPCECDDDEPEPVDCVPGPWSDWSPCSSPCGEGEQTRTRSIETPASNGGAACDALSETQACVGESDGCPLCASGDEGDTLELSCDAGVIINIQFAAYGTPEGTCGEWRAGECNGSGAAERVPRECLGRRSCSFTADNGAFGDPCPGTPKEFVVQYECSGTDETIVRMASNGDVYWLTEDELVTEGMTGRYIGTSDTSTSLVAVFWYDGRLFLVSVTGASWWITLGELLTTWDRDSPVFGVQPDIANAACIYAFDGDIYTVMPDGTITQSNAALFRDLPGPTYFAGNNTNILNCTALFELNGVLNVITDTGARWAWAEGENLPTDGSVYMGQNSALARDRAIFVIPR